MLWGNYTFLYIIVPSMSGITIHLKLGESNSLSYGSQESIFTNDKLIQP